MISSVRQRAGSRFAAALVALALSGVPALAAGRPPPGLHSCACPAHRGANQCSCAHAAHKAAAQKAPPCHAKAAQGGHRDGDGGAAGCSAKVAGCGQPEATVPPERAEVFTLPDAPAVVAAARPEPLRIDEALPRDAARKPETPPPRRG